MTDRVDKKWKEEGLTKYSISAIVGTLKHYGAQVEEAAFGEFAKDKSPLEIAMTWRQNWKGTGPWAPFPYAAANELIAKVFPDRVTPMKAAEVVMACIVTGTNVANGKVNDFNIELTAFEKMAAQLPTEEKARTSFLGEMVGLIEGAAQAFNELASEAKRMAAAHELLFPDRKGMVMAVVRAHLGERDAAVSDLKTWAGEASRDAYARYSALDSLYQLTAFQEISAVGLSVFDAAAQENEWGLADSIAHLLAHVVKRGGADAAFAKEVQRRLNLAHEKTGGHH
jgi:hypothetical protein